MYNRHLDRTQPPPRLLFGVVECGRVYTVVEGESLRYPRRRTAHKVVDCFLDCRLPAVLQFVESLHNVLSSGACHGEATRGSAALAGIE